MSELAAQKLSLVGREAERGIIGRAIENKETTIVFLEGNAGTGKTMLLEEAERIAHNSKALCSPLLDFYDTRMHSHQGLEAAIAQSLDPKKRYFAQYWQRRQKEPQAELWAQFCLGYSAIAESKRIVLRFDTAERLAYERDSEEVLRDCEVEEVAAPSWQWLLRRISDLPNTAVIIAARPVEGDFLRTKLKETYGDRLFDHQVAGFTLPETQAYLQASEYGHQMVSESPDIVEKVHELSGGRPILLALALDWLQRGDWDRDTLETIRPVDFERVAVEQVRVLQTPLDKAIKFVALCRKGCNDELLARLMGIDLEKARELSAQLQELSFVKPPRLGSRDMFFLHDEMYDLVEKYVWLVDWPDYREQAGLDRVIIDWYTEQIAAYREHIRQAQDWQERGRLRREQQLLIGERLYYHFDGNPRLGYREYSHLDEEAIARRELEWDTWLCNEALWFMSHRAWRRGDLDMQTVDYPRRDPVWLHGRQVLHSPAVDYDSRRRWVSRYIARNEVSRAVKIAEKLLAKPTLSEEPELYRGGVRVALATAQAYLGGELAEASFTNFDDAIHVLERVCDEHKEPWLYPYLLATAYLYKGIALRGCLFMKEAAEAYNRAVPLYQSIGYDAGAAEARNNLAYIYARMGEPQRAVYYCSVSLRKREEEGDGYPIGLSLNTEGIIYERRGQPNKAIESSQKALNIFRAIGNERGTVLAEINLGRSFRRKGRTESWQTKSINQSEQLHGEADFVQAEHHLCDAIQILESRPAANREQFYEVEAYDEWGCLHRDWAATLFDQGTTGPDRLVPHLIVAETKLQDALGRIEQPTSAYNVFLYVDILEDWGRVYYWWARAVPEKRMEFWAKALQKLGKAREAIEVFGLRQDYDFLKGKIHHQYARIARDQSHDDYGKRRLVAQHLAKASGYHERFSPYSPELGKTVEDARSWFTELYGESWGEAESWWKVVQDTWHDEDLTSGELAASVTKILRPEAIDG